MEHIGGCRSPPYAQRSIILLFFSVAGLRNKMPVLSHSPPALLGGLMANVATPQQAAAAFAGGRFAPLPQPLGRFAQHIALRLCRSAPLRPLHPQPPLRDGLTKLAFCHRSPLFFAAVAASGRSLRSLRAAARRILAALAGGVRSNRQGLRAAARTARQQVHIIV